MLSDLMKISINNKHIQHVLSVDRINEMTQIEQRYPITRLPVCNHCEALALWSKTKVDNQIKRTATCLKCGYITYEPITYAEYLVSGYDLPDSMNSEQKEEIKVKRSLVIDY